jgi:RNA polymerase sigma factor (sigma-70 family)
LSKRIDLLAELSDEEIQERIAAKEISQKEAVEELLTRHIPSLYRFLISRYSLDEALVNDVVGESALVILEDYTSYDPKKGSFISWAFGIAHNKLREHLRKE